MKIGFLVLLALLMMLMVSSCGHRKVSVSNSDATVGSKTDDARVADARSDDDGVDAEPAKPPPTCPAAEESVIVDLSLQLDTEHLVIRTTNVGCEPIYQNEDCCGWVEMPYGLQVSSNDGWDDGWEYSMCNPLPEKCLCDTEPVCKTRIDPGETIQTIYTASADNCSCPGGEIRVRREVFADPTCSTRLTFYSNALSVGCATP